MPIDPLYLIAIGGMVLAVIVLAIFMGRDKDPSEDTVSNAQVSILFEDDHACLRRFICPVCSHPLRQEVNLRADKPRLQHMTTESGLPTGDNNCPVCNQNVRIEPGIR